MNEYRPALEPILVSPKQAEKLLDLRRSSIWKLMMEGQLETVKIGRSRRIKYSSLRHLVETAPTVAARRKLADAAD